MQILCLYETDPIIDKGKLILTKNESGINKNQWQVEKKF